jgi:hypothetical protein
LIAMIWSLTLVFTWSRECCGMLFMLLFASSSQKTLVLKIEQPLWCVSLFYRCEAVDGRFSIDIEEVLVGSLLLLLLLLSAKRGGVDDVDMTLL